MKVILCTPLIQNVTRLSICVIVLINLLSRTSWAEFFLFHNKQCTADSHFLSFCSALCLQFYFMLSACRSACTICTAWSAWAAPLFHQEVILQCIPYGSGYVCDYLVAIVTFWLWMLTVRALLVAIFAPAITATVWIMKSTAAMQNEETKKATTNIERIKLSDGTISKLTNPPEGVADSSPIVSPGL